MTKKNNMVGIKVIHNLFVLFFVLAMSIVACGCSAPAEDDDVNHDAVSGNITEIEKEMELTLYFYDLAANPEEDGTGLLPIRRIVPLTEALARATVTELLRGPTLKESRDYGVGPVVTGRVSLSDIYIKDGICVIHLDYEEPLFSGLPVSPAEAELLFIKAIVYSLESIPGITAVWVFYQDSPWQGDYWQYYGPVTVPGKAHEYQLYYRNNNYNNFEEYIWQQIITPLAFVPEGPHPFLEYAGDASGPFYEIVEQLTSSYSSEYGPTLPKGCRAESFNLHQGVLTINLAGRLPAGYFAAQAMIRSLIYTFTALPEVERVIATINGETFSDGRILWNMPLGREDLD